MIPREIHDPEVLHQIAKEAMWTGEHCLSRIAKSLYLDLSRAADSLATHIEGGEPYRATCHICKRNLRLKAGGVFRYHSGCIGEGRTPKETEVIAAKPLGLGH